jgi:glycosyltransferase involved in cell wall biosynthesis
MPRERKTMRIAFLGDGSLGHVRRWAGYFHERGHDVLLVSFEDVSGCPFPARRLRKLLPTKLAGYAAALGAVKKDLAAFGPDIINAIYAGGYGFIGAQSGFRPLVISTLGSDMLVDYPSSFVHRLQIEYALRRASLVTADSASLTASIVRAGVEPSRIVEIYFGIDPSLFNLEGRATRSGSPLRIVSTRNLYPVYGLETLIASFAALCAKADALLTVCGDGPERGALERMVAGLGIAGRVTFTGRLEPSGIADELRKADIYVSTSTSDSTSVSLLEAMACGAVPVVTDLDANREWIHEGVSGLFFSPRDEDGLAAAMLSLHEDHVMAESMREEAAAAVAEKGLWLPNMQRAEMEFSRLVEGGKARR